MRRELSAWGAEPVGKSQVSSRGRQARCARQRPRSAARLAAMRSHRNAPGGGDMAFSRPRARPAAHPVAPAPRSGSALRPIRLPCRAPAPIGAPSTDRDVAQPGSASHWGCGGRRFESSRPDQWFPSKSNVLSALRQSPVLHMRPTRKLSALVARARQYIRPGVRCGAIAVCRARHYIAPTFTTAGIDDRA